MVWFTISEPESKDKDEVWKHFMIWPLTKSVIPLKLIGIFFEITMYLHYLHIVKDLYTNNGVTVSGFFKSMRQDNQGGCYSHLLKEYQSEEIQNK